MEPADRTFFLREKQEPQSLKPVSYTHLSFLAQGGICMLRGEDDYEDYFEDTMRAGHYENNKKAVDLMLRSSNSIIRDLLTREVDFERNEKGDLEFTREGAHSQPRILFHEDITGKEITSKLLAQAQARENVEIVEYMTMVDLISADNICGGVVAMDEQDEIYEIRAPYVVLACGGLGGLYKNSTNFPHITGDALGIAMKHGILLENIDYIQIHPTTLYSKKPGRRFLISESVRGEEMCIRDRRGSNLCIIFHAGVKNRSHFFCNSFLGAIDIGSAPGPTKGICHIAGDLKTALGKEFLFVRAPYRGDFCKSLSAFAYVISVSIQKCKAQGF